MVTEESDKKEEERHIEEALDKCGYPSWAVRKVKGDILTKRKEGKKLKKKAKEKDSKTKGLVILPYVKGLSESVQRVFRKHHVATAMKPHQTIRNVLVHPKDKTELNDKSEIVYKIGCQNCEKVYIGETGRNFGYRLKEHKADVEQNKKAQFTRSEQKQSETEYNKSGITDHANCTNHVIDWEGARALERESDQRSRHIKEAIQIRLQPQVMNRDDGAYKLSHVYDSVFAALPSSGGDRR